MQKLLLIAVAGGLGALSRYGLAGLVQRWTDSMFPWGTAVVNVVGCFVFGLLWVAMEERFSLSPETRVICSPDSWAPSTSSILADSRSGIG
jgi:fluoride exporter